MLFRYADQVDSSLSLLNVYPPVMPNLFRQLTGRVTDFAYSLGMWDAETSMTGLENYLNVCGLLLVNRHSINS